MVISLSLSSDSFITFSCERRGGREGKRERERGEKAIKREREREREKRM